MENITCICGHENPYGTIICANCGCELAGLKEAKQQKLIDMRYEGSARRSQTYNKTIVDKVWNFFSSVKVGVWIIVLLAVASAFGTIYPQQQYIPTTANPAEYYEDTYGVTGELYYLLGFHNLFESWWYKALMAALGVSLVIASLDRFVPLYRSLKKQGVTRQDGFMKRQRLFSQSATTDEDVTTFVEQLKKRRYNIREENGNILAEKGRFSRWGPYVNHIGLIIFLLGLILRGMPGMYTDETLWVREGQTREVPGTDGKLYLKNEQFNFETYEKGKDNKNFDKAITMVGDGTIAKKYETQAVLYERVGDVVVGEEPKLKEVKRYNILVNYPLKYNNYAFYQMDFRKDDLAKMHFALTDKKTGASYGELAIDLYDPKPTYSLPNGYEVKLVNYFPDFELDENGKPRTKTKIPNNPAFVFKMISPTNPKGDISFVAIRQTIDASENNALKMKFVKVDTVDVTALTVRRDFSLWVLGIGGTIFMIGVVQGMYWHHRRVWVKRTAEGLLVAGHTNKNWYGLRMEIAKCMEGTALVVPVDQLQEETKPKEQTV